MKNSTLVAFIAGAAVGAALALLHTEKGAEIKERIKKKCAMKAGLKAGQKEENSDIALEHSVAAQDVE